jgi:hypothetical protein
MKRDAILTVLQIVATVRQNGEEMKKIVDDEALQVGDRNVVDHAIATLTNEIEMLSRTFRDMLEDPTKSE